MLSFACVSNWLMDNAVYQEKLFTLSVMALQKQMTQMQLISELETTWLDLEEYMVFDNDFKFHSFREIFTYGERAIRTREEKEGGRAKKAHSVK